MPMNPTMPSNNFKLDSALGGYVSGIGIADYLDGMNRDRATDDLNRNIRQNEYDQALLDNPVKQLERELKGLKASTESGMYRDNTIPDAMREKIRTEVSTAITQRGTNAVKEIENQSDFYLNFDRAIKTGELQPANLEGYRDWVKKGAAVGIRNMPPMLDPIFAAQVAQRAQLAPITKEVLGSIYKQGKQNEWQAGQNAEQRASAERQAALRATGRGMSTNPNIRIIQAVMDPNKETITTDELNQFVAAQTAELKKTPIGMMLKTQYDSAKEEYLKMGNKAKTLEPFKNYKDASDYANSKTNDYIADSVAPMVMSYLSGKALTKDGNVVGMIDEKMQPKINQMIKSQISGSTYESASPSAPSATPAAANRTPSAAAPTPAATPTATPSNRDLFGGADIKTDLSAITRQDSKIDEFVKFKGIKTMDELKEALKNETSPAAKQKYQQIFGK